MEFLTFNMSWLVWDKKTKSNKKMKEQISVPAKEVIYMRHFSAHFTVYLSESIFLKLGLDEKLLEQSERGDSRFYTLDFDGKFSGFDTIYKTDFDEFWNGYSRHDDSVSKQEARSS